MLSTQLAVLFEEISSLTSESSDKSIYAVVPVPDYSGYFVGKDKDSLACLLVSTIDSPAKPNSPILLESLDVQFGLLCHLTRPNLPREEKYYTVIRCRDSDSATIYYFYSICEMIIRMLGDQPLQADLAIAVDRLVAIFQKIQQPPTRSLNGLFGELFFLFRSSNTVRTLKAWRIDQNSRFDFSDGNVRLDIKTTSGRKRSHTFSYEQCNPSPDTIAVVVSLHIEQITNGMSLLSIVDSIEQRAAIDADLVLKLHENIATTLGSNLKNGLSRCFDMQLAQSSLKIFDLKEVPAIRCNLPEGVSGVHFRSDLTILSPLTIEALVSQDPVFDEFLPKRS